MIVWNAAEGSCPVPDQTLGELYRAGPEGLGRLIATVPPATRALLAIYCFRRAHLASIGLAIAEGCERDDLMMVGGNAGAALFDRSREPVAQSEPELLFARRRKITLSTGPLYQNSTASEQDTQD